MPKVLAFLVSAGALLFIADGCFQMCQAEDLPAVEVEVVDAQGEPVAGATVEYSVDGGRFKRVPCTSEGDDGICTVWTIDEETTAEYVVKATTPEGATGTSVAEIEEQDDCDEETKQLRIVVE